MKTQRNPNSPRVISIRPMTAADLEALRQPSARTRLKSIRDSHHIIARCLASGLSVLETAARCGYTATRISMIRSDPAFEELVARYRDQDTVEWLKTRDEFWETATANMQKAERMLADTLDDAIDGGTKLPVRELLAITADRADRFGYGKHTSQTNINVDFAARLESARRRIEAKAEAVE